MRSIPFCTMRASPLPRQPACNRATAPDGCATNTEDTIGDRHDARDARGRRQVTIGAVVTSPATRPGSVLENVRAVHLSRTHEARGRGVEFPLQRNPSGNGFRGRITFPESVIAGGARVVVEGFHANRGERFDPLAKRNRSGGRYGGHVRPTSARRIFAPSPPRRSSMRS